MASDLDTREYDLLRLVKQHGPIGSIQLRELMQLHGYSIQDRTIRLTLAELDEQAFTKKIPGKGRRITDEGERELREGNIDGRLERIRTRIGTLTSQVTYDPIEDTGIVVVSEVIIDESKLGDALALIEHLDQSPMGPTRLRIETKSDDRYRLLAPSSITLDGVLLNHGISANLTHAGVVDYKPDADSYAEYGGRCVKYIDMISGEKSSIDVVSLLIEAGRSDVTSIVDGERGLLLCDHREFPINRFDEARDLTLATRSMIGGTINVHRPRERDQHNILPWGYGGITNTGIGETLLALFHENDICESWNIFYGSVPRRGLTSLSIAKSRLDVRS